MEEPMLKIAFSSPKTGCFQASKNNLEFFIENLKSCYPEEVERPVGIISVLGTNNLAHRRLFTDWVIHFFENEQNPNGGIKSLGLLDRHEYLTSWHSLTDGVYCWPKLFEVYSDNTSEPIWCLILYSDGTSFELDRLVINFCSQAIVFRQSEKDKLEKTVANLNKNEHARMTKYIIPATFSLLSGCKEDIVKAAKTFFGTLEKFPVSCKKTKKGEVLNTKNLIKYLEDTIDVLNDEYKNCPVSKHIVSTHQFRGNKNENGLEETSQSNLQTQNGYTTDNKVDVIPQKKESLNREEDKKHHKSSTCLNLAPDKETRTEEYRSLTSEISKSLPNLTPNDIRCGDISHDLNLNDNSSNQSDVLQTTCNSSCLAFQSKLFSTLVKWLSNKHSHWHSTDMIDYLLDLRKFDTHNHFDELEAVCEHFETYMYDLYNMFDNYVCFYGDEDNKKLIQFSKSAYNRESMSLKEKQLNHMSFLQDIFSKACSRAHEIMVDHNSRIVENEISLAKAIKNKLLKMITKCAKQFNYSKMSHKEIKSIIIRIQQNTLAIVDRCMDKSGKLNHVVTETSEELLQSIRKIFKHLKPSHTNDPLMRAIVIYQRTITKVYENPLKFEHNGVYKYHRETVTKSVYGLTDTLKDEVTRILEGHLIHFILSSTEKRKVMDLKSVRLQNDPSALCIYVAPNWIRLFSAKDNMVMPVVYGSSRVNHCPPLIAVNDYNRTVFGFQAKHLLDQFRINDQRKYNIHFYMNSIMTTDVNVIIQGLFRNISYTVNRALGRYFAKILVLVPSWYNLIKLTRIRLCSEKAGFSETYICRESAVIARDVLSIKTHTELDNLISDVAVAAIVAPKGVGVEIFGNKIEDTGVTVMLGSVFVSWTDIRNMNSEDVHPDVPENADSLFEEAYIKALKQAKSIRNINRKYCFLLADDEKWEFVFDAFFTKQENITVLKTPRDIYGVRGAAKLSLDVRNIRERIIDFVRIEEKSTMFNEDESNKQNISIDTERNDLEEEEDVEEEEILLKNLKTGLIKLCNTMLIQMDKGEVKVSRLFQKSVKESLERAIAVASDTDASMAEVEYEEREVKELRTEHDFI